MPMQLFSYSIKKGVELYRHDDADCLINSAPVILFVCLFYLQLTFWLCVVKDIRGV